MSYLPVFCISPQKRAIQHWNPQELLQRIAGREESWASRPSVKRSRSDFDILGGAGTDRPDWVLVAGSQGVSRVKCCFPHRDFNGSVGRKTSL